jgi:hypothetical protein
VNRIGVRLALVVLALIVGVWLAFGLRSVFLIDDGEAVMAHAGRATPAELDSALDDYAKAGRLSPDQTPLIDQGQLLLAAGRQSEAAVVARRATEAEPDNLQAWYLAWRVAFPDTPAQAHAQRRLIELNPWFAYALRRAAEEARKQRDR